MKSYCFLKTKVVKFLAFASCILFISSSIASSQNIEQSQNSLYNTKEYRQAVSLYERGVFSRAMAIFDDIYIRTSNPDAEAYSILCSIALSSEGYVNRMNAFERLYPYSSFIPQHRFMHALNLFDNMDFSQACLYFNNVQENQLRRSQRDEYIFKKAYANLELGNLEDAMAGFKTIESRKYITDFTAPSLYSIGYINYRNNDFKEAIAYLSKSSKDSRFKAMADYYILESKFMLKDYDYVIKEGEKMYVALEDDRKARIARILSESYLVKGDAEKAREYYDLNRSRYEEETDADYFYSGSVLYAVEDYKAAIEKFSKMKVMTDSLGQIASYQLAFSHIKTKNKVAAYLSFKTASESVYNPDIAKDAYFNYAKLAFDLNTDASVFYDYLKKYPDTKKTATIYSYIALAALYDKDYAAAIDAYAEIDELDKDMKSNYVKANYLRAEELISSNSYRKAIPCLQAVTFYSDKRDNLYKLARFHLAESYYRNEEYDKAKELIVDMYNKSALEGYSEFYLTEYNLAYCYFRESNYKLAIKWFEDYLSAKEVKYKKDAMERIGDCYYMLKDYKAAAMAYDSVISTYNNPENIYPYLQSAISYGLLSKQQEKIDVLVKVRNQSPQIKYYSDALFELGRAYVEINNTAEAELCFKELVENSNEKVFVAKSLIELGMISGNRSDNEKAVSYYKSVVSSMPNTVYAQDALLAMESIYQLEGRPEEYLAYLETIGKSDLKSEDERELMIFNSAEQVFLTENYQKALPVLMSYAEKYPQGPNLYRVYYYIAESYKELGKMEKAKDYYELTISSGQGSYVELSMVNYSKIAFDLQNYEEAYLAYSTLKERASLKNNRSLAMLGMLRSAVAAKMNQEVISSADAILTDKEMTAYHVEAQYSKAKSLLATSHRDEAFEILKLIALKPTTAEGAEAKFILIQDCYDRAEFTKLEDMVYDFSDSGTPQMYWLAKSFIVLGDSFVERGNIEQAKATYESVRDGYDANTSDDILEEVNLRLSKLK